MTRERGDPEWEVEWRTASALADDRLAEEFDRFGYTEYANLRRENAAKMRREIAAIDTRPPIAWKS